ncbi:Uncharacterised protein [Neisseria gonorrhoeae]|uniref:Uncharacterized protein n=1 Tax=Neisseria gonorrhoeae TaxID=485 RepID=A0A379B300_NEIGO|nr:Uncharacterised protein [Neisseria gonorrhoeae]
MAYPKLKTTKRDVTAKELANASAVPQEPFSGMVAIPRRLPSRKLYQPR